MLNNVLPYQNICMCWWSRKYLTHFFISIVLLFFLFLFIYLIFFGGEGGSTSVRFTNFNLILNLQYAWNSRIYIKVDTKMFVWHPSMLCTFTWRHLPKRYKTFSIFLVVIYLFLIVDSFLTHFVHFDVFLHVLMFLLGDFD